LCGSRLADTATTVQDDRLEKHLKSVIQKNEHAMSASRF
jgi:hypothetical protein